MVKRIFLLIVLATILASATPVGGQGNVLQNVTGCLDLAGYTGYIIHAPLALAPEAPPYRINESNGMVYQRLGATDGIAHPDTALLSMTGVDAWNSYDDVAYLDAHQVVTLVLYGRNDVNYLDIWRDGATWFIFPFEDLRWYAIDDGQRVYAYHDILKLWHRNDGLWATYHWGWHPCGAFIVNANELPSDLWNYLQ